MNEHKPVMAAEVVRLLSFDGPGWIVDGTLGLGGHSSALLDACPRAMLLGMDRDPETMPDATRNLARFGDRVRLVVSSYSEMGSRMRELGISGARAILVDLGWSSRQISDPSRGLSFSAPGPLDMRFDRSKGLPLSELLSSWDEAELARMIREYGEEKWALRIANRIKKTLSEREFRDTVDLSDTIAAAVPRKAWPKNIHVSTRCFQAFRIAVNGELDRLDEFLENGARLLEVGGRMAALAFHSLEDKRVKARFRQLSATCTCPPELPVCRCKGKSPMRLLTRGAEKASPEEIESNPRSRSARLRAMERIF